MDKESTRLLALQRILFSQAEQDTNRSQYGHLAVFVVSLISLILAAGPFVYVIAIIALAATATGAFFRHRAKDRAFAGNRVPRLLFLSEGLG